MDMQMPRWPWSALTVLMVAAAGVVTLFPAGGQAAPPQAGRASNPFCQYLGSKYQASAGAWAFCFGAQPTSSSGGPGAVPESRKQPAIGNVDAASLAEDISPSGVRGYGQSGPSVAAAGRYVMEAWTDAVGLFTTCPVPRSKELTGIGFSSDGGASFTDLGGPPNSACADDLYGGDPSVVAYEAGGHFYFYVLSLYDSPTGLGPSDLALAACQASSTRGAARLRCSQPVVVATSSACRSLGQGIKYCSFLDKGFMTVDPRRGRLYISYSEFPVSGAGSEVQLAVCDLGRPAAPVCENGTRTAPTPAYLTLASPDPAGCQNEGAYPAVDPQTGAVYVGYEYNWGTDMDASALPPCADAPTTEIVTKVPLRCLTLVQRSPCRGPVARRSVPVTSLDAASVSGYGGVANDFPRLAVSPASGTVSMVWNDASRDPLGDILMQSFALGSLQPVQHSPVMLNHSRGGLHMLPAMRVAAHNGLLDVSWFARASAAAAGTGVWAAIGVSPRARATPRTNVLITTVASNWSAASSDLTPDFGDYTDNAVVTTRTPPYAGCTLFIAWTDGRRGLPQPFSAHLRVC